MAGESQNVSGFDGLENEFVAYLDGEADNAVSRRLEELIARDEKALRRMRSLERVWNALDTLPRVHASERFTSTTVEMIALREGDRTESDRAQARKENRRFWFLSACIAVALASVAGAWTVRLADRPNQELLENLSVIENMDQYRQISDLGFLRKLSEEGLFDQKPREHGDSRF